MVTSKALQLPPGNRRDQRGSHVKYISWQSDTDKTSVAFVCNIAPSSFRARVVANLLLVGSAQHREWESDRGKGRLHLHHGRSVASVLDPALLDFDHLRMPSNMKAVDSWKAN